MTGGANLAVVGMGYRGLLEVEGGVGGGELVPAATAAGTATTPVEASPQRQRSTFLDLGEPMVSLGGRMRRHMHVENLPAGVMDDEEDVECPKEDHSERWVRSVRTECLDHVFIFNERHLAKVLAEYVDYFNHWRPHRSIGQHAPCAPATPAPHRSAQAGKIIAIPVLGGLHHVYRWAA